MPQNSYSQAIFGEINLKPVAENKLTILAK